MVKYLANDVVEILNSNNLILATGESCTGGMLASAITDIAGSSAIFERGFITYSNQSKIESLGVNPSTIDKYGAVSSETAAEMALGILAYSKSDIAIAITGVAGPNASQSKPVGLVYIAYATVKCCQVLENNFKGDRHSIRYLTVIKALELIKKIGSGEL